MAYSVHYEGVFHEVYWAIISRSPSLSLCSFTTPTQSLSIETVYWTSRNAGGDMFTLTQMSIMPCCFTFQSGHGNLVNSNNNQNRVKRFPFLSVLYNADATFFFSLDGFQRSRFHNSVKSTPTHAPLHWVVNELLNVKISSRCLYLIFFFNFAHRKAQTNEWMKAYTSKVCSKA